MIGRANARIRFVLILQLLLVSCAGSDDGPTMPGDDSFQDLTQRDHVIHNLALAYRDRNLAEIDRLLDVGSKFCYDGERCWHRDEDLEVTRKLFEQRIKLPGSDWADKVDIVFSALGNNSEWVPSTPPDPGKYPGETLWEKNVGYLIRIKRGEESSAWAEGGVVTFVVRVVSVGFAHRWRAVLVYDHGGDWGELKSVNE